MRALADDRCPTFPQRAQPAYFPQGGGYLGQPSPRERRLGWAIAISASVGLLSLLAVMQGQPPRTAAASTRLTSVSLTSPPAQPGTAAEVPKASQPRPAMPTRPAPRSHQPMVAVSAPSLQPRITIEIGRTIAAAPVLSVPAATATAADSVKVAARISQPAGTDQGQAEQVAPNRSRNGAPSAAQDRYAQAVFQKIRREQRYEAVLRRDKLQGTVIVEFTIDRRGNLRGQTVAESSAVPLIDRLALRHVAAAAPFPRPPGGLARIFQIPLTYRQRD